MRWVPVSYEELMVEVDAYMTDFYNPGNFANAII